MRLITLYIRAAYRVTAHFAGIPSRYLAYRKERAYCKFMDAMCQPDPSMSYANLSDPS